MRLIDKLFHPIQNCEETTIVLCKALQIAYARKVLAGVFLTHLNSYSLLKISDVVKDYVVENISVYLKGTRGFAKISLLFIAQIVSENKLEKMYYLAFTHN